MRDRDLILLLVVGLGGFAAYNYLKNKIPNAIAQPLANFYVWLTSQGAPVPQGVVVFPDYSTLPAAQLPRITWYGNAATFVYNGGNWQLLSHDSSGNYPAIPFTGA